MTNKARANVANIHRYLIQHGDKEAELAAADGDKLLFHVINEGGEPYCSLWTIYKGNYLETGSCPIAEEKEMLEYFGFNAEATP